MIIFLVRTMPEAGAQVGRVEPIMPGTNYDWYDMKIFATYEGMIMDVSRIYTDLRLSCMSSGESG
jgi:hypothetical protein